MDNGRFSGLFGWGTQVARTLRTERVDDITRARAKAGERQESTEIKGTAAAASVHVDDVLPSEVTYISALQDAPTWTFSNTGNDLNADLTGTLAPAASRFFWIRVQVN